MKYQVFTLLLLIIGVFFFQPTHQYRLSKRELTEYDLTNFIVSTCSIDKSDMVVQGLCDQTLQSALMGNFPFLTYYCKTIGVGMRYCNNLNRHTIINQNAEAKRFIYRRLARNLKEDKKMYRKSQQMNTENDLEQQMIMEICITKTEKNFLNIDEYCNQTLEEVQQERYPKIKHFCKYHPEFDFCQHVQSNSLLLSWQLSKSLSPLSLSLSSIDSISHNINPSFTSSSVFKSSAKKSIIN